MSFDPEPPCLRDNSFLSGGAARPGKKRGLVIISEQPSIGGAVSEHIPDSQGSDVAAACPLRFTRIMGLAESFWRRGRDSNPRNLAVHLISNQTQSTTLPPLLSRTVEEVPGWRAGKT